MYRNFNAVVGRPFRVALLRVQTVARLKPCPTYKKSRRRLNLMYRNFNAVVGRPFRVALLRVQTVARLKPCPTYKKSIIQCIGISKFCRDALYASCVMQFMVCRVETHAMRLYINIDNRTKFKSCLNRLLLIKPESF